MENIKEKVKKIMAVIFDQTLESIPDDAEPLKIDQWDSLNHLQLIVGLEEEFNIKFNDEELTEITQLTFNLFHFRGRKFKSHEKSICNR